MRLFSNFFVLLLMLVATEVVAVQLLSYPVAQVPECNQGYENTPEPKSLSQVLSALNQICSKKGGERVINKGLTAGNSSEPTDVIISCIGENPADHVMFYCTFGVREGD